MHGVCSSLICRAVQHRLKAAIKHDGEEVREMAGERYKAKSVEKALSPVGRKNFFFFFLRLIQHKLMGRRGAIRSTMKMTKPTMVSHNSGAM